MAVNPAGMGLREWADATILSLQSTWAFGRLDDETKWQDWAVAFVRAPHIAQRGPPDPYAFSDWQDWAMRTYLMLEGL